MSVGLPSAMHPNDILDRLIESLGGSSGPSLALRGDMAPFGPPAPRASMDMQPSQDLAFTPAQRIPEPGSSFMDRVGMGLAGADLPGPNGYASSGQQFLQALAKAAVQTFSGAQMRDIASRQKTQDALEQRAAETNRRNADLTDRKAMAKYGADLSEGVSLRAFNRDRAATLEDRSAKESADNAKMVSIPRSLAVALGNPAMTGHAVTAADLADLERAVASRETTRIRANGGTSGPNAGWSKSDTARYKSLSDRLSRMDTRQTEDSKLLISPYIKKDIAGSVNERITKRQKDMAAVEAEMQAIEDRYAPKSDAAGSAGGAADSVPAAAAGSATPAAKPLPRINTSTGTVIPPPGDPNARLTREPAGWDTTKSIARQTRSIGGFTPAGAVSSAAGPVSPGAEYAQSKIAQAQAAGMSLAQFRAEVMANADALQSRGVDPNLLVRLAAGKLR